MPRGRSTSLTIRLRPAERLILLTWQRSTTIPAGQARRGRLLLLLADGMTITDAAAAVGLSPRHAYKWIQRFLAHGMAGLANRPGRGHRRAPQPPELREQPDLDVG